VETVKACLKCRVEQGANCSVKILSLTPRFNAVAGEPAERKTVPQERDGC
jgi:hypothetical protein